MQRKLGIGCAAVAVVIVGTCIGWYRHETYPRSVAPIPPASALVVTTGAWLPRSVTRIDDPSVVSRAVAMMNAEVDAGWHPPILGRPLPRVSIQIVTRAQGTAQWDIGEGWFGAAGLYKEVPETTWKQLEDLLRRAPSSPVEGGSSRCRRVRFDADAGRPHFDAFLSTECARAHNDEFHSVRLCKLADGTTVVGVSDIDTAVLYYFDTDAVVTGLETSRSHHPHPLCTVEGSAPDDPPSCTFVDPCEAASHAGGRRE